MTCTFSPFREIDILSSSRRCSQSITWPATLLFCRHHQTGWYVRSERDTVDCRPESGTAHRRADHPGAEQRRADGSATRVDHQGFRHQRRQRDRDRRRRLHPPRRRDGQRLPGDVHPQALRPRQRYQHHQLRVSRLRVLHHRWRRGRRPRETGLDCATRGGGRGLRLLRRLRAQSLACRAALSSMPLPCRLLTSSAPVTELRRNSRPSTPDSSRALTVSPEGSFTFEPAVM